MRRGWATVLAVLAMVVAGPVAAAWATDPVSLGSAFVVDEADALSGGELSGADATLAKLENDTGISLYVALVPDFTNPSDRVDWANTVAKDNGLGERQYLLADRDPGPPGTRSPPPTTGRSRMPSSMPSSSPSMPQLRGGDWAGAIDTAADGVRDAAGGGSGAAGGSGGGFRASSSGSSSSPSSWSSSGSSCAAAARRRAGHRARNPWSSCPRRIWNDARAQPSSRRTTPSRRARRSSASPAPSSATRRRPNSRPPSLRRRRTSTRRSPSSSGSTTARPTPRRTPAHGTRRSSQLCTEASTLLDEKAEAFDELRKLEQNAPEALARVQERRAATSSRASRRPRRPWPR